MEDHDISKEALLREMELLRERIQQLEALHTSHEGVEKALLENEELYRAVVETVADGIAITVNTERVFVNRAFLAIHGLRNASEIVGHPLDQLVFPEDREDVRRRVLARQRGESLDELVEYRIRATKRRDKDGAGFGRYYGLQGTARHPGGPPGCNRHKASRNGDHAAQRRAQ